MIIGPFQKTNIFAFKSQKDKSKTVNKLKLSCDETHSSQWGLWHWKKHWVITQRPSCHTTTWGRKKWRDKLLDSVWKCSARAEFVLKIEVEHIRTCSNIYGAAGFTWGCATLWWCLPQRPSSILLFHPCSTCKHMRKKDSAVTPNLWATVPYWAIQVLHYRAGKWFTKNFGENNCTEMNESEVLHVKLDTWQVKQMQILSYGWTICY